MAFLDDLLELLLSKILGHMKLAVSMVCLQIFRIHLISLSLILVPLFCQKKRYEKKIATCFSNILWEFHL